MRKINYIVIHCTATVQSAQVSAIQRYWREKRGWKHPGYHYIIEADGHITVLQEEEKPSNGVKGYNQHSINLSYIGGLDASGKPKDNRTTAQRAAMRMLVVDLKEKYPMAAVKGHRDFPGVKKACPSFEVSNWLNEVGIKN